MGTAELYYKIKSGQYDMVSLVDSPYIKYEKHNRLGQVTSSKSYHLDVICGDVEEYIIRHRGSKIFILNNRGVLYERKQRTVVSPHDFSASLKTIKTFRAIAIPLTDEEYEYEMNKNCVQSKKEEPKTNDRRLLLLTLK